MSKVKNLLSSVKKFLVRYLEIWCILLFLVLGYLYAPTLYIPAVFYIIARTCFYEDNSVEAECRLEVRERLRKSAEARKAQEEWQAAVLQGSQDKDQKKDV